MEGMIWLSTTYGLCFSTSFVQSRAWVVAPLFLRLRFWTSFLWEALEAALLFDVLLLSRYCFYVLCYSHDVPQYEHTRMWKFV
jgi:hypothetical protein